MTSLTNMFYDLDNSTENKQNKSSEYKNNLMSTPALNQGTNFKNYQNKIKNKIKKDINNVNSKEGFQNFNTDLAKQSKQTLSETRTGKDKSLQNEYNSVLLQYQKKLAEVSGGTTDFFDRLNPQKNPYLNKNIQFTTYHICYVTNQGVVKWIPTGEIWDSLRNSPGKNVISVNIPWLPEYDTPGATIATTPSLVSGTKMALGETCGNEGLNVYVDKLITDTTATYNGCYKDTADERVMSFIGGAPSTISGIVNGNFDQPIIKNNTYQSVNNIPGWSCSAVLLNNASVWNYPMPYPNGNQCMCFQNLNTINQTLNLSVGNYTISFIACGRPSQDGPNPIDIQLNGTTIYSITPTSKVWTSYSTPFTVTTTGNNTIYFNGTNATGDKSSAIQNVTLDISGASTNLGTYTYDTCKNAAIDGGYKYFGLQNVNTNTSMGYCAASNDYVSSTKNGTSNVVTSTPALWSSKTNGSGTSASLTNQGTLTVYNSTGAAIFNTTVDSSLVSGGYIGCYNDKENPRAMTNTSNNKWYSFDTCKQYAKDVNYGYYGNKNKDKNNNGWCVASNDLINSQKYGIANNCTTDASGNYMGGFSSNAIYSMDGASTYFLILQDDGNMVIYKGTGPNDNQGAIWSSETNGKQQQSNSSYTADKGKYGQNWIASGSTLASGDFVGSTDGALFLIMQSDGNLVLYTSTSSVNCQKMNDDNMGGGEGANALYELLDVGIPANLGKIGYVDSNSLLSIYGDSNIERTTNEQPPKLKNLPVGVSNKIVNIDSLTFENYPKTDKMSSSYGLATANTTQKQELEQLKTRLDQISQQLLDDTNALNTDEIKVGNQSTLQTQNIANYLNDYKNTNAKIKNSTSNITGIVHDSDINVLKENYNYYFWSILAVGTVLVTMNITKK